MLKIQNSIKKKTCDYSQLESMSKSMLNIVSWSMKYATNSILVTQKMPKRVFLSLKSATNCIQV